MNILDIKLATNLIVVYKIVKMAVISDLNSRGLNSRGHMWGRENPIFSFVYMGKTYHYGWGVQSHSFHTIWPWSISEQWQTQFGMCHSQLVLCDWDLLLLKPDYQTFMADLWIHQNNQYPLYCTVSV